MKCLFLSLAAVLLLVGTVSAQWGTYAEQDRARELDRMRGNYSTFFRSNLRTEGLQRDHERIRRRLQNQWQGSGSGMRSNSFDGGW